MRSTRTQWVHELAGLARVASFAAHDRPFRWMRAAALLDPQLADELAAQDPAVKFKLATYRHGGRFWQLSLDSAGATALSAPWNRVTSLLTAPAYTELISELTETDLRACRLQVSACRYEADCWLGPHTDRSHRVVTQLIYLSPEWRPEWGGCLRILNSDNADDVAYRVLPRFNSSVVFLRSDRSWHAVEEVRSAPAERLSLILHWSVRQAGAR
jgi:SM-20-related protein